MTEPKKIGLELLRQPFADNQISKLPKPTKKQTDDVKADYTKGKRCTFCGGWHHPDVVHLDYVGHAALTDRLLDVDPNWNWEPLALGEDRLPRLDKDGGMWIKLTIMGITRLGYGDAEGKAGGNAVKERIGDALRNAAMRFGAALDLWHKGDLHVTEDDDAEGKKDEKKALAEAIEKKELAKKEAPKGDVSALDYTACHDKVKSSTSVFQLDARVKKYAASFNKCTKLEKRTLATMIDDKKAEFVAAEKKKADEHNAGNGFDNPPEEKTTKEIY
jgi:hypothetical protein